MNAHSNITPNHVLTAFRDRAYKTGFEFFKQLFDAQNPPDIDFIQACFTELNRQGADEEAYAFLKACAELLPKNGEVIKTLQLAQKIFYDSLIAKGNSIIQSAAQKAQMFAELDIGDIAARQRLEEENKKTVQELLEKAVKAFERAKDIMPDSQAAYHGLLRCYKNLELSEKAAEASRILEQLKLTGRLPTEGIENEELPPFPETFLFQDTSAPFNPELELRKVSEDLKNKNLDEALTGIERFLLQYPASIEALHLKVRILTEKKLFKPAWNTLQQALAIDSYNPITKQLQIEFLENKLKILMSGAELFLNKAFKLGPSLGREQFIKAQKLLEQALEIAPDDINILDQLYTCAMYLEDERRAAEYRTAINAINPQHITTVSKLRGSSLCFLAGFAYKEDQNALEAFRRIRRVLIKRRAGRYFVTWYVRLSPFLVQMAMKIHFPPILARTFLYPLLFTSKLFLKAA